MSGRMSVSRLYVRMLNVGVRAVRAPCIQEAYAQFAPPCIQGAYAQFVPHLYMKRTPSSRLHVYWKRTRCSRPMYTVSVRPVRAPCTQITYAQFAPHVYRERTRSSRPTQTGSVRRFFFCHALILKLIFYSTTSVGKERRVLRIIGNPAVLVRLDS